MTPTSGLATAAMIVPASTGVTMVEISASSQIAPTSTAPTPTRNQASSPRSRSQVGASNIRESSLGLSSSTGVSAVACGGFDLNRWSPGILIWGAACD